VTSALLTCIAVVLGVLLFKRRFREIEPRLRQIKPRLRELGRRVDRAVTLIVIALVVVYGAYAISLALGGE